MSDRIKLLGISGSLRAASHNLAILRTLAQMMPDGTELSLYALNDVPLYNADLEQPDPPAPVADFRQALHQADGIVVCTPEYNAGISGVLKNALDWASRPAVASPLKDKAVLIMSSSPAFTGGARAHAQLRETFASTLSRVVVHPPVVIAAVHEKVRDGRLTDDANLRFALGAIQVQIAEIRERRQIRMLRPAHQGIN